MRDNIMFYPAIVLMVIEAVALVFLIWAWFDAKRRSSDEDSTWDRHCGCCGDHGSYEDVRDLFPDGGK